ncbi:hypothetical protein T459_05670 [Capsicum annuum]|uniref:Calmodulin-binding domain-containing protein n=1 Tax=Capsicum annuum TaxID=4072 RepID=A0A2G3A8K0_CAPAN|nr:hypothetical protein T459_05670 [Capsicum annuum]
MWYNRLSEYLSKEGYTNDEICPCIFIKKTTSDFVILVVYVDDINLIGTPIELQRAIYYLKKEFEVKDLGNTKLCLGLQIEHLTNDIFVRQSAYTEKVLKRFYMDGAHSLSTPMVARSLDVNKDPFRPQEKNEELLNPEIPYVSAIGALMYLANTTRPDIDFSVNLLARYSFAPTRRHWNGIKHILQYLKRAIDMGLFYSKDCSSDLIGYVDAGYLSNPHKSRSQTGYVFICGGTSISWRSTKQSILATLSNHAEIIVIHEANRECQNLCTPPGSVLGEKKKVTGVEQKPSTSPGSILREAKKRTVVMQKTSTTSGSNQTDAKKGILVKQKLSTPPVNMLEEGKKVNEVYQKPSAPQESVLKDENEVTMVEQKPSSPPGCMEGGIDEVTVVEQKSSASLVSMLGEGENVTVVEQKLSTPPGSMLVEGKKGVVVNQKPSAPPGKKSLKTPTLSSPPKSSSVKPLILRVRSNKSLKLLAPLKDQNKMRRDGTNKLNPEMVPEKTLRTPKVKASPKSSSHLQSRPLSNEEDKKEVVKPADSALGKYTSSSKKLLHIAESETIGKNQKKTLRKGKTGVSNDNNSSAVKLKFRRGKIVDLQQETCSPRRLTFRWGRHVGESQDSNIRKRIFKNKVVDGDKSNTIPISGKIILRHQDVQEKKDVQGLLNNVIEETASKLIETGKSKVKALVGDFETVISIHNKPSAVIVS